MREKPTLCMKTRLLAHSESIAAAQTRDVVPLRCKQWDCDFCAQMNRETWVSHLINRLPKISDKWFLVTLTAHRNAHRAADRAAATLKNILGAQDKFIKRVRRAYPALEYVRVLERHKSGAFHVHFLATFGEVALSATEFRGVASSGIRYRGSVYTVIKTAAIECGMGYIVDVRPLVDGSLAWQPPALAARYVTKYMTKGNLAGLPPHTRRVQTSRGIGSPKPGDSERVWALKTGIYLEDILSGVKWYWRGKGSRVLTADEFLDHDIFPPEFGRD